ncbi:MAG: hypothetical protein IKJ45_16210, partial [Kiritimatiellae bacterium]|nr:hypothetical protein [Kiritimatiellia bacterium]
TPTQNPNYYIWDCTEPVATRPLAWFDSAPDTPHPALYYAHDGNKNVSEVVDIDDIIAAHYEYAPFGAVTTQRGESAASNPWCFSSEYAEDDTATVYYNYRHYEPVMGRWMNRDPIDEDYNGNVYAYIENNTQGNSDCLGLRTKTINGVIMCRTNRPAPGYEPSVNGCGSGWNTYLVPDADYSIIGKIFGVDFEVACNRHDRCYGTCAENKNKCDRNLQSDMKSECDKIPSIFFTAKLRCKLMADIFYSAVDNLGEGPFEDAQDNACAWDCCGLVGGGWEDVINALPY